MNGMLQVQKSLEVAVALLFLDRASKKNQGVRKNQTKYGL
jgi:hypothetical protein